MRFINNEAKKGDFTLPGEAGYEQLTLHLAEQWGADVIRDSDGTKLSPEILTAEYDIYSTVCVSREHNAFANRHPEMQMETILQSFPSIAVSDVIQIRLLDGYFEEQFAVDDRENSRMLWQVFDRTENVLISIEDWEYDEETQSVSIRNCKQYHKYTVNYFAYRIWEEISMYNHLTNHWTKEHLKQINPAHMEVREYLLAWMEQWCVEHPDTNVVRFTSLFFNSAWIWGSDERNRFLFSDWASYDFSVSPEMFALFEKEKGFALTCEDFVNKNRRHNCHTVSDKVQRIYMEFLSDFVLQFAKQLIAIVHRHGKQAYVFYDDSWIGLEPYSGRFEEYGFDGIIKCMFSGYEVRLCANVEGVKTHEIRLHPYLFQTGLTGEPVFAKGGDPVRLAQNYWRDARRALLRQPVQRIGLGGYLHLTEEFPDFCTYMTGLANEFRTIKSCHEQSSPYMLPIKISVLTSWGKLRTWTCGGHFHEHSDLDLLNLLESLSGLPIEVEFIDFEDLKAGNFSGNVILNAGQKKSAWSGSTEWESAEAVTRIMEFVHDGGVFLAVNESSEVDGFDTNLRMAHLLGVDIERGEFIGHGKYRWQLEAESSLTQIGEIKGKEEAFIMLPTVKVLKADGDTFSITENSFGEGKAIYMSSYRHNTENAYMLLKLLLGDNQAMYISDNPYVECACFPQSRKLIWINNSDMVQEATVLTEAGNVRIVLQPDEMKVEQLV